MPPLPIDPSIIAGGLKAIGSLFGRKKTMTPAQSINSTAAGVRSAAEKYGFNALTLLNASNATAGAGMEMGAPPLASLSVLGDLVEEKYGEDAVTRREHNRLQNELLTLEVDRARTLSAVAPPTAVGGASLNGGYAAMYTESPVGGDFLDEDDRGSARVDERDATASVQSHGQETVVPVGPDFDEVMSGWFVNELNKGKARKAMLERAGGWTKGSPLAIPQDPVFTGGLGGPIFVPNPGGLLPPKPKAKASTAKNHLVPDGWYKEQFN